MKKSYSKALLALSALALTAASAQAEGTWRNINSKLVNPGFIAGWSGALTQTDFGIGEAYNGAFEIYQVISDLPAGEYTLSVNAFYRPGRMHTAADMAGYLFLGDQEKALVSIEDGGEGIWSMETANAAFEAGRFLNTISVNHKGGDLRLGLGSRGTSQDEWSAFDNFKLTGPEGDVEIVNGDFSQPYGAAWSGNEYKFTDCGWECTNIDGGNKQPDANRGGGMYRKTNASPYNFGQLVELPAGKYRWGVQSFLRHGGAGNGLSGKYITCKGAWGYEEGESAWDLHQNGKEAEANNAYIYVTNGWDTDEEDNKVKPVDEEFALDEVYGNPDGFFNKTAIKCLWDEELEVYPDNLPLEDAENADGYGWCDSGWEYQVAKLFVNNPNLYRNYVEFELTEPSAVWVGINKDINAPKQYWNPFRDFTLEVWAEGAAVEGIEAAAAAPEYFNLQGVRVANPAEGIFIVREGNKVSKKVIR